MVQVNSCYCNSSVVHDVGTRSCNTWWSMFFTSLLILAVNVCCSGVGGYDGDGDITKPENLVAFQEYVLEVTSGDGVHFVMADGVRIAFPICKHARMYLLPATVLYVNKSRLDVFHRCLKMHNFIDTTSSAPIIDILYSMQELLCANFEQSS